MPGKQTFLARLGPSDRISGTVLLLVAAFAVYEASHLPFGSIWAPDAGFFPLTLSVLLLVFAFAITLGSFVHETEQADFSGRWDFVVGSAVALIVYALVVQFVGFVVSTICILVLLMRGFGRMSWTRTVLIAVPAVIISYIGFLELGVPLPRGILPF